MAHHPHTDAIVYGPVAHHPHTDAIVYGPVAHHPHTDAIVYGPVACHPWFGHGDLRYWADVIGLDAWG